MSFSSVASVSEETRIEHLEAFAKAYGYVRYFHPSDEAASADWDGIAVEGVSRVVVAKDSGELRDVLTQIFAPVAPTLQFSGKRIENTQAFADDERITYWQYLSLDPRFPDRHRRVIPGSSDDRSELFSSDAPPPVGEALLSDLYIFMPTVLAVSDEDATVPAATVSRSDTAVSTYEPAEYVANVINTWTRFQHFHPYLTQIGIDWDSALSESIRRSMRDETKEDHYATLMSMIALTNDGHGYVFGRSPDCGDLGFKATVVEGKVVVFATEEDSLFNPGDVVVRINGQEGREILDGLEAIAPGSPQLSRYRALNQFAQGAQDAAAVVDIERDGEMLRIETSYAQGKRKYFFHNLPEVELEPIHEIRPGVVYMNLTSLDRSEFQRWLPKIETARGIVFDQRLAKRSKDSEFQALRPHVDIIPHLIDEPIQASPMLLPQITQPDRKGWTYSEVTWPVEPREPRLNCPVVWINRPHVVSYGETCMAMIDHYDLGKTVGQPTAGTNGGAAFIQLNGGFRVMWTTMDVLRHDRSPFYGVGFAPDVRVDPTVESIRAGRDLDLEAALGLIEQQQKE